MNMGNMLKTMLGNKNPKDLAIEMIKRSNNNPLFTNLINMAETGDNQGVEQFARNLCNERGIDFDKEFGAFIENFR